MQCHGNPDDAPGDLLQQYDDTHGFHDKTGDIRALFSIRMPLSSMYENSYRNAEILSGTTFLALTVIFIIILYFIRQLDKQESMLSRQKATAELASKEKSVLLRNIIDSMPSILIGVDNKNRITLWNRQAELASGIISKPPAPIMFIQHPGRVSLVILTGLPLGNLYI